jgi:hypothetical protein
MSHELQVSDANTDKFLAISAMFYAHFYVFQTFVIALAKSRVANRLDTWCDLDHGPSNLTVLPKAIRDYIILTKRQTVEHNTYTAPQGSRHLHHQFEGDE